MLHFKQALTIFILTNVFLYFFIWTFHFIVPFNHELYTNSAYHYIEDTRISERKFNLSNALAQYDAQWYLRIAQSGYPNNPDKYTMGYKLDMDRLTFAFFPLYPLLLKIVNLIFANIEFAAFVLSVSLQFVTFYSLYWVVSHLYDEKIAFKSTLLIFLFPFGIFFRSYFSEGIFLLLLIWYSYFLIKKDFLKASLFQGLLAVTRPTGLFLIPLTLTFLFFAFIKDKKSWKNYILSIFLIFGFFALWMLFNFSMTGDLFFWKNVQSAWFKNLSIVDVLTHNYLLLKNFPNLPLHSFHLSKIDLLTMYIFGWGLTLSISFLKKELWLISFLMWFVPVVLKDTMSFSRYQAVSFPLFIFLASKLNNINFPIVSAILFLTLLFVSLYFVNWYWLG